MIDIIIPHTNADEYRRRNLFFIIRYYKEYLPESNIILVEQNTETDITELSELVHLHMKIKTTEPLFCKSYLLNEGYNAGTNKYIIFADTDCAVDRNIMSSINSLLPNLDTHVILPYNRPVINLTETQTLQLIANHKTFNYGDMGLISRGFISNGGVVMISSENYYKIGGHDPRFIGWGGEDDSFYIKSERVIGLRRLNATLFHLNHPKNTHGRDSNPHYSTNYNLYRDYATKDNQQIINAVGFSHLIKR